MTAITTRFRFGENWSDFVSRVSPEQMVEAETSLRTLLGRDELNDLTFLDVGSGSGLFSLAAAKLGARVTSFDYDAESVETTRMLRDASHYSWEILKGSILDEAFIRPLGRFDIVYSWGVLHHTGAMWTALECAASLVKPGGTLAIAIYRKTPMCSFWRLEKRLYSAAPRPIQAIGRGVYKAALLVRLTATGHNPIRYVRDYQRDRGMRFHTNVHDWLGGYPYESADAAEIKTHLRNVGFSIIRSFERPAGFGLFGSGCDEFVAQRSYE